MPKHRAKSQPMLPLPEDYEREINELMTRYPSRQAAMLPVLYLMQNLYGAVSDEAVVHAAEVLKVPPATVYGVLTFYTLFKRPGEGRHTVWVCSTLSCALSGSERVYDHLCARLSAKKNETTSDRLFTLKKQECLGACDKGPVVQIDDDYYFNVTPDAIDRILGLIREQELSRLGKEGE